MAKKVSGSYPRARRAVRNVKIIPDSEIDYSDIPPLSDEQLAVMRPLGRPILGAFRRKLIAVRLDPVVLAKLKLEAKSRGTKYQTLINDILAKHVKKKAG